MKKQPEKIIHIFIVDFEEQPQQRLVEVLGRHGAQVVNWMTKDYGLLLEVEVPVEERKLLEVAVADTRGYEVA